ncbi:unnamed protein product [Cuscuta campestris]|uniref:DUF4283 domain-containing protein n=1 Tax=Cuscuta campestris TaxID=132261 RepID=A0A484LIM2_9ASTE|nr:unnamed protein product [Cuscuta campestris]
MGNKGKRNTKKKNQQNSTNFVFDGTPISDGKNCKSPAIASVDGSGSGKQLLSCLPTVSYVRHAGDGLTPGNEPTANEEHIDSEQTADSSLTAVSVTLPSFDTLDTEDRSLSAGRGPKTVASKKGKAQRNATQAENSECSSSMHPVMPRPPPKSEPHPNTNVPLSTQPTSSSAFRENRSPAEGIPLNKVDVGEMVVIPYEGYTSLEDDWGFCLVGCFTGRFPGIKAIEGLISSWHVQCKLLPHERGWVIFQFLCDEDRMMVLHNGPYMLFGKTLLLRILPEGFRFNFDAFMTVDIWVKFIDVPLQCWNKVAFDCLGSRVGTPLCTDQGTKRRGRVSFCRMLIKLDMSKELPLSFEVCLPDGDKYIQKVVYEGLPKYCYHCTKFGHNQLDCRVLRALHLKKNGEFVGKATKDTKSKARPTNEGVKTTTSRGQNPKRARRRRARKHNTGEGSEAIHSVAAMPKPVARALPSTQAAKTDVVEKMGNEGVQTEPTATLLAAGTDQVPEAKRKKKKKTSKGEQPIVEGTLKGADPPGDQCTQLSSSVEAILDVGGDSASTSTVPKDHDDSTSSKPSLDNAVGKNRAKSSTKTTKKPQSDAKETVDKANPSCHELKHKGDPAPPKTGDKAGDVVVDECPSTENDNSSSFTSTKTLWQAKQEQEREEWYDRLLKAAMLRVDRNDPKRPKLAPDKLRQLIVSNPSEIRDAYGESVDLDVLYRLRRAAERRK